MHKISELSERRKILRNMKALGREEKDLPISKMAQEGLLSEHSFWNYWLANALVMDW